MTAIELLEFLTKFRNLLNVGKKARLVMECENGQAYVNLEVKLGHSHQNQPHVEKPFRRGRRAGPSRLRRREHREQARLIAAEQAAASAVQAGPHPHHEAVPRKKCGLQTDEAAHHHQSPLTVEEAAHPHQHHAVEEAAHP